MNSENLNEVKSLSSLFSITPEMAEVHRQLVEVTRRIERIEQRLPSSWIPQYRIRNDSEYTPLGGVLDKIFEQIDDIYDKMEESFQVDAPDYQKQLDKLNKDNGN